jgi:hypothetical protein
VRFFGARWKKIGAGSTAASQLIGVTRLFVTAYWPDLFAGRKFVGDTFFCHFLLPTLGGLLY